MCEPTTIALVATAAAGTFSAVSAYQQGQVNKQIANNNAKMAEYAAQDAQRKGELDAQMVQRKASQLSGTQRSMMASRGLDISSGTPAELLDQTDFFGQTDANTARFNASQDAWAYKAEAQDLRSQGKWAARNANTQAFASLLGTTGAVADKWSTYTRKGP